jgi:hypothetical protein
MVKNKLKFGEEVMISLHHHLILMMKDILEMMKDIKEFQKMLYH